MDHYSWVATAAMLVWAITVPIVGKLSDLYGRRPFYLGGLVIFIVGSPRRPRPELLVADRRPGHPGHRHGLLMHVQTIIGDIIPPVSEASTRA